MPLPEFSRNGTFSFYVIRLLGGGAEVSFKRLVLTRRGSESTAHIAFII